MLFVLFLIWAWPRQVSATPVHGTLRVVKGDVQVLSHKTKEKTRARIGGKVFPMDRIMTGKDARAKIVMIDKNEINISPESEVILQKYEYQPEQGKKDVLLNVIYGKVRSKVEQKYDGKTSKFQVRTPGAVAGVRGTDFLAGYNRSSAQTEVVTFSGQVEFGAPGPGGTIINAVPVAAGQSSWSLKGQPPAPPAPVSPTQMAQLNEETQADPSPSTQPDSQRTPAQDESPEQDSPSQEPSSSRDEPRKEDSTGSSANTDSQGTESKPGPSAKSPSSAKPPSGDTKGPGRAPASGPSPGVSSGMLLQDDFAGSPGAAPVPLTPLLPPPLPTTPTLSPVPVCDFCNRAIEDSNTKLILRIITQ